MAAVYMSNSAIHPTASADKVILRVTYQVGGIASAERTTQSHRIFTMSPTTSGASSQQVCFAPANERKSPHIATK